MIYIDPVRGTVSFVPAIVSGVSSVNGRTGAVVLTSADVGLGNANNTSDANKPISIATAAALTNKADLVSGVVPTTQIPAIAITTKLASVGSQAAMLALSGQEGDWTIRTDLGTTWVITGADPTQLSNWTALSYPTAPVNSVNGQTGVVVLTASDVGAQPLDSDLTAIAALTTNSFGRGLLALSTNSAVRSYIGAGTSSFDGAFLSLTARPTDVAGYGITDTITRDANGVVLTPANIYFAGKFAYATDDHIDRQMQLHYGAGVVTDQTIFTTLTHTSGGTYVRNTNNWLRGTTTNGLVDLTSVAVYNSDGVTHGVTLISPRHFVCYPGTISIGTTIRFVTNTNTVVSRTVSSTTSAGAHIIVGKLDSDVPNTISFAKVLPVGVIANSQIGRAMAYVSTSDQKVWCAEQGSINTTNGLTGALKSLYPLRASIFTFLGYPTSSDGGSPYFYVFERELVLAGIGNEDQGSFYSANFNHAAINAAMTTLGGGYQLTDYTSTVLQPHLPIELQLGAAPNGAASMPEGVTLNDANGKPVLDLAGRVFYDIDGNELAEIAGSGAWSFQVLPMVGASPMALISDIPTGISYNADNLSELTNFPTARANLGLAIGTNVQAYSANLATWSGLAPTTVGQNLVTLANPGSVRYIRIDASNGITLRTAAQQLADLGGEPALGSPGTDGYVLSSTAAGVRSWISPGAGGGGGDASTNTSSSIDSELAIFSGTGGKTLKRATGSGIVKLTSGVLGFGATTSDLTEGTNLYYTDVRVRLNRLDQLAQPTASVSMNSQKITSLLDPVSAQDAATKAYVDATAQGLSIKTSVVYATTAALPTNVYSNGSSGVGATLTGVSVGALSVDGSTPSVGDRILVKDEATASRNGIYIVTTVGSGVAVFVLTRSTDMDQSGEMAGSFVFVEGGTVNAGSGFVVIGTGTYTVGTTAINWTQFSGAGEIVAGAALTKSGNTLDVGVDGSTIEISADALRVKDAGITLAKMANLAANSIIGNNTGSAATPIALSVSNVKTMLSLNSVENTALSTWAGTANITTLGTITTGTWQSTVIDSAYLPGSFSGFGNPSGLIGMSAVNGSATTGTRSDATHAIDPAIAPTWTGLHTHKYSDAATSTVVDIVTYGKNSSGTPAASFGGGFLFNLQSSTTADRNAMRLSWYWTTATDASRASAAKIALVTGAGSLTDVLYIFGSGGMSLNANSDPGAGIFNANTGFRIGNAAASGNVLRGNGTNFVSAVLSVADLSDTKTGTGNIVLATSPTLVTPLLGTPTSGTLTNCTGLPEAGLSLTDVTTNDASTTKHGFLKKLDNNAAHYQDGTGNWSTPPSGSLGFAGNLTAQTTINNTVTYTTGGVTLASQTAANGSTWRVRASGQFVAANSATARNGQIAAFWGSTQLTAITWTIPTGQAVTRTFQVEFVLNGTSTTAITAGGYLFAPAAALANALAPTSTTVTSGAQTLDLRFSMSVAVASDQWLINTVTIERTA